MENEGRRALKISFFFTLVTVTKNIGVQRQSLDGPRLERPREVRVGDCQPVPQEVVEVAQFGRPVPRLLCLARRHPVVLSQKGVDELPPLHRTFLREGAKRGPLAA